MMSSSNPLEHSVEVAIADRAALGFYAVRVDHDKERGRLTYRFADGARVQYSGDVYRVRPVELDPETGAPVFSCGEPHCRHCQQVNGGWLEVLAPTGCHVHKMIWIGCRYCAAVAYLRALVGEYEA